jgi:Protein NO VEIN, C-terminal
VTISRNELLFSMSAFDGLLAIRRYRASHPRISLADVVPALKRISPDEAYHDYEAALILHSWVDESTDHAAIPAFFRQTLNILIERTKPWWVRFASFGRERLRAALTVNEAQCFQAAELFSNAPDAEIMTWWDALAQTVRADDNSSRLFQGREAEQMTIAYETQRLSLLGITNPPRWVALDDNSAGYDVHSFDQGPVEPIARLIEVKSCARRPPEIFLTRNEWETAIEREPNYRFHIWILPEKELIELRPSDVASHVPQDRGNGLWQIVRIGLPLR